MYTRIKTDKEIEYMRTAGGILAATLRLLASKLEPGMSTKDLADIARREMKSLGGEPAFLNYPGPTPFPDVICISVNDEVVHGIPSRKRILQSGDLVSLDLGVHVNGLITDGAITVACGDSTAKHDEFLAHTRKALEAGLKVLKNGTVVGDVSYAIQKALDRYNYGIVRDLVGHGVGHAVHEEPNIPNFGQRGTGPKLVTGMTLAIEPMATLGKYDVFTDDDGWTMKTSDGSLAAHFEHTVLMTDKGNEILTI